MAGDQWHVHVILFIRFHSFELQNMPNRHQNHIRGNISGVVKFFFFGEQTMGGGDWMSDLGLFPI